MVYLANENRYEKMPYRRNSNSGLILPEMSFGLWRGLGDEKPFSESRQVILKAFDEGIFSFDNASNYGPSNGTAEDTFGNIYKKDLYPYRNELIITTKAGYHMWPGPYGEFSSKKTLVNALELSLKRMNLDYVDVFYAHRWDPNTSLRETAEALDLLVRQGKTLYVGVSNYTTKQTIEIAKIFKELNTPFIGNQVSYNMLNREAETSGLLEALEKYKLGLIAYGPLAEGVLTNKFINSKEDNISVHKTNQFIIKDNKLLSRVNKLNKIAQNRNQTLNQMAMAWLLIPNYYFFYRASFHNDFHLLNIPL